VIPGDAKGTVRYCHQDSTTPYALEHFTIADEGRTLRYEKNAMGRAGLLQLPTNILNVILNYAWLSHELITFDMDARTAFGLSMNTFHVNKDLRRLSTSSIHTSTVGYTELQASAVESTTNFNEFAALKDLLQRDGYLEYTYPELFSQILRHHSTHRELRIKLKIETAANTALDQVRIDIKELICLIHNEMEKNVSIHIILSSPNSGNTSKETVLSLQDLQKRAFLLLFDVLTNWPFEVPYSVSNGTPSIWINGHGHLIEASYRATAATQGFLVGNRHGQLRDDEVIASGYRMETMVLGRVAPDLRNDESDDYDEYPVWATWRSLQRIRWPDYRVRRPRQIYEDLADHF
jgi:hypothetical protein